jgi:NADH-quinone oxidoreductase subunit N
LLSIFVGSFGGLREKRLKTLLAYSSISHMGYALIAFSTSTSIGVQMLLFYVLIYMLSGLSIWYVIILLVLKKPKVESKSSKELSDLTLLKKSNLILSICLALSAFSVAGIPPLIGFFAKLNVFLAVVGDFFYVIGLASIFCSVVSTFYYIRIIKVLYFENFLVGKLYYPIKTTKIVFLGILTFLLLFFFVNPTVLYLIDYKTVLHLL